MAVTNIVQENNASERLQQSKNGIELRNKVKKGDPNNSHSGSGGNDETPPPIPPHRTPVGSRPKSAMSIDRIDQPIRFVIFFDSKLPTPSHSSRGLKVWVL